MFSPTQSQASSGRVRTVSVASSVGSEVSTASRKKRKAIEDEELNTKTFKMSDLIAWKPKGENELRKKWDAKKKELKEKEIADAVNPQPSTSQEQAPVRKAPQMKLNDKGELVIDEESLEISQRPEDFELVTVHEDLLPKKLNSLSYKKNLSARSTGWINEETELFYFILAATGPDFGLMHDFFPTRTRAELKKKFKKEESVNMERVNETLQKPALLDPKFQEKAKERLERIEGEKKELLEMKKNKRKKKAVVVDNDSQDSFDEDMENSREKYK